MSMNPARSAWVYVLITALAPIIWGSTYIVTTELLPPDRPFTAALLRTLPAGILLVLWSRHFLLKRDWAHLLILAALNIGFFQALLFVAAYRLPGGLAAVVGAMQPLLVMALAWGIDGRQPVRLAIGATLIGVLGMAALLLSPGAAWDSIGMTAALVGTACMAGGTFFAQRWRTTIPLLAFTGWQLLLGGVMLIPVTWMFDAPLPMLTITQALAYAYLSIFGALLSYALWFQGIAKLSPVAVSSLALLSPVTAVVIGWSLLGQSMTGLSLVGLVAVLGSVLTVQWALNPHAQNSTRRVLTRMGFMRP